MYLAHERKDNLRLDKRAAVAYEYARGDTLRMTLVPRVSEVTVKSAVGDSILPHTFRVTRPTATVRDCIAEFRKKEAQVDELSFKGRILDRDQPLKDVVGFWAKPTLVWKYPVQILTDTVIFMNVLAKITVTELWKTFCRDNKRVFHTRPPSDDSKGKPLPICKKGCVGSCSHTWFSIGDRELEGDERLEDVVDWAAVFEEGEKLNPIQISYDPPPFGVTLKEKDEKNQVIETELEISDNMKIFELKNKYSKQAEEGLVEGDLLLLDDQELKDDRTVYSYQLRRDSQLIIQKKSLNQPTFTYVCADCGNDLKLRKEEKIRCRECGHRVVYKPRMTKSAQHFAR